VEKSHLVTPLILQQVFRGRELLKRVWASFVLVLSVVEVELDIESLIVVYLFLFNLKVIKYRLKSFRILAAELFKPMLRSYVHAVCSKLLPGQSKQGEIYHVMNGDPIRIWYLYSLTNR
jgi:hypothetical protein